MNKDVVIYQSSDGLVKMEAIVDASNETIWVRRRRRRSVGVNVSENLTNRLPFIALMRPFSFGFFRTTASSTVRMAPKESPTAPSSH